MSKLPKGWTLASLGEITVPKVEQGPPSTHAVPYIDISSIDRQRKTIGDLRDVDATTAPTRARQWVKRGDVLVSMTRPNLNAVAMVSKQLDGSLASTGFDVLRPIGVAPGWVFSRVRSNDFVADVCEDLQGVVYPAIRPNDVRGHRLPIPPHAEQHRIVEAIESYLTRLDDAVATLERVQRNLKRYRASVLKAAVEGRLVRTEAELARKEGRDYEPASVLLERILKERRCRWIEEAAEKGRARAEEKAKKAGKPWNAEGNAKALENERAKAARKYKEPPAPDTDRLPELPEGWGWTTAEQLGDVSGGLTKNSKRAQLPLKVPYLRVANVYADELRLDEIREIGLTETERERTLLQPDDLLIVEGNGSIEQIGRVALWDGTVTGCTHQNHIIKVRFTETKLSRWCLQWLMSPSGRRAIVGQASSTSGLHTLSISKVSGLAIPLAPLGEAQRIATEVDRFLSISDASGEIARLSVRRCQRLRQSILKRAFEGKLVDQDPNDEAASVLLERIKAERAAMDTTKKNSRKGSRRRKAK